MTSEKGYLKFVRAAPRMKITISGTVGAGKSTVAKAVAKELGYQHHSVGDFMRQLAKERNTDVLSLSEQAMHDDGVIDRILDDRTIRLGKTHDNFVLDGHISFHFVLDSFKVFLDVAPEAAAKRILAQDRADETHESFEHALKNVKDRRAFEKDRYKKYYGLDIPPENGIDLMIDTTAISAQEVVDKIIAALRPNL